MRGNVTQITELFEWHPECFQVAQKHVTKAAANRLKHLMFLVFLMPF
jgi:hypothetical protein